MRRRFLLLLATLAVLLILSAATVPLWLGLALRWAGGSRGLTFGRYERDGYGRFVLHEVELKKNRVTVKVSRLEGDTPLFWWRHGVVVAEKWSVDVTGRAPTDPAPPAGGTNEDGWRPLQTKLHSIAGQLERWVPRLTAGEGTVRWPGSELKCASATWADRALAVQALTYRDLKADAKLAFPGEALRLAVRGADFGLDLDSRGAEAKGTASWLQQPATVSARFGERGWMPTELTLAAENWRLPGERLKLSGVYESVQARGRIEWREQKLLAEVAATSEPVKGKNAPPLDVTLKGQGDWQAFTLETVNITLPGVVAKLTAPVTLERSGQFRESGARFTVEGDLAKQPWWGGAPRGTVAGEARWVANLKQSPVVEFQLSARDVAAGDWAVREAEAKGQFQWPRIQVSSGSLVGTGGEKLALRGGWDFRAKEVLDANVEGTIRRATIARWVPPTVQFDQISLTTQAAGPLSELRHTGRAQADGVKIGELTPFRTATTWAGEGGAITKANVDATFGTTSLAVEGSLGKGTLRLVKLELTRGEAERLALREPATITLGAAGSVQALHLAGSETALDAELAWGGTGKVEASVKNFSSVWLRDFGFAKGPAWQVNTLTAKGGWERGPLTLTVDATASVEVGEGKKAELKTALQTGARGLTIDELSVVEGDKSVVKVTGRLPLRISPASTQSSGFAPDGELALDVATDPNAGFWAQLASLTGFELKEPEATAHVIGTWSRPQGVVRVKAARVTTDPKRFQFPLPRLESLDVEVEAEGGEVRLTRAAVQVEGQAVRGGARLPVAEGQWMDLVKNPVAWARRGVDARLEIPDADVAALARFLPVFMAPKGRLSVDLNYKGGQLGGSLKLQNAATRLLGPLGVLQEISADIAFEGRKVALRSVTAQSGGQTVTLSGSAELPEPQDHPTLARPAGGSAPAQPAYAERMKFDVSLKGDNLPFVRQTGVLVRGDLDLKLVTPGAGTPRITGTVRLRDSLFLSDIRALLPGGVRTKATTPPYFSVEAAPYSGWRLDVAVQGERFFKLRTALFTGVASAKIQLTGTLGDPLARGEATVEEGQVKLPFATFAVQEGRVVLSPEQGLEPQLTFMGTVRRLGYDLKMEATGPASHPNIVFSSSPPLESGQVALMVMAGQAPHEEIAVTEAQRATQIGAFVGQSLISSLSGESDSADRLSISSGENVSRQGRETYNFEYRLTDRWSAVLEFDEYDERNLGLKWRAYSVGGTEKSQGGSVEKKKQEAEKKKAEEKKP